MDACVDWAQGFPLTYPEPDGYAVAISRGVSAVGGATDFCFDNLAAAWPLILETGRTAAGRAMLSEAFRTCKPLKTFEEVQGLLVSRADTPAELIWLSLYPVENIFHPAQLAQGSS